MNSRNAAFVTSWRCIENAGTSALHASLVAFGVRPGDEVDLETAGEEITLRPVRETPPMTREQGVWVFRIGKPLPASTTDETLRTLRDERDQQNLGPPK